VGDKEGQGYIIQDLPSLRNEKTADISRRRHCFPREMTSEKLARKFDADDV